MTDAVQMLGLPETRPSRLERFVFARVSRSSSVCSSSGSGEQQRAGTSGGER